MTKITPKVMADARLKLEKDIALAMPCIEKEDSGGNLRHVQLLLMPTRKSQIQKTLELAEK